MADDKTAETTEKLPYPKGVLFMYTFELLERFNYYGFRTILSIYLKRVVGYNEDTATFVVHMFIAVNSAFCIAGAIAADNYLGRYRTILYFTICYTAGMIVLTIGNIPPMSHWMTFFCLGGLGTISLGSGGLKPCVTPFAGDQFTLPEQKVQLVLYFSINYAIANAGSLVAEFVTPLLRAEVRCFGELHCYALAFGVPALLMVATFVIFVVGTPWYKRLPAAGNMLVKTFRAIGHAIAQKIKTKEKREHWVDHADDKFEKQLIEDIKVLTRILLLVIPLPIFFALYDQLSSRWPLQAARMDGEVGNIRILPEQIHMLNPILVLIFIPLCDFVIYPAMKLIGIQRPLQKMISGCVLVACAFFCAGFVELLLEKTYPRLPEDGNAQLRIFNSEVCSYDVNTNIEGQEKFTLSPLEVYTYKDIEVNDEKFNLIHSVTAADAKCPTFTTDPISIPENTAYTIFLNAKNTTKPVMAIEDNVDKPKRGYPQTRLVRNINEGHEIVWKDERDVINENKADEALAGTIEFQVGTNTLFIDGKEILQVKLRLGGRYTILVNEKETGAYETQVHYVTEPNSMHMLWQVPQYILVTMGEIMTMVTGPRFAYPQAPITMKSVVYALYILSSALGNVIFAIAAKNRFMKQSYEFFLFAMVMIGDIILFIWLAIRYKPNDPHSLKQI